MLSQHSKFEFITHCDRALYPVVALSFPAILSPVAPGDLPPAEVAAYDFELQCAPVVKMVGLTSEYSCLLFAVTARAWQLGYAADVVYFADQVFLASAARAVLILAVVVAFDLELPDALAVEKMGPIS